MFDKKSHHLRSKWHWEKKIHLAKKEVRKCKKHSENPRTVENDMEWKENCMIRVKMWKDGEEPMKWQKTIDRIYSYKNWDTCYEKVFAPSFLIFFLHICHI